MRKWLSLVLIIAVSTFLGPRYSQAEQESYSPSNTIFSYITLIDEFTLYANETTKPKDAIGALSALQSVPISTIEGNHKNLTQRGKLAVETWLGTAWIDLTEGAYKYGKLVFEEKSITLLEKETAVYDSPNQQAGYSLAPQVVESIASISPCDPYRPCSTYDSWYQWYLIRTTFDGEKWIRPHHYAEKYVGKPVDGMIALQEESPVYLIPFEKPLEDEPRLAPQVVKVVSKYTEMIRMVLPNVWYQIDTPQGLRWVNVGTAYGLGFENVEKIDIQLDIPFHSNTTSMVHRNLANSRDCSLHRKFTRSVRLTVHTSL